MTGIDLNSVFKALAHPLRRQMLLWLKEPERHFDQQQHGFQHGVCAGQFDQRCGLSQSTVSNHLACLQRAGLINCQRIGQWNFFSRNEALIQDFLDSLARNL